MSKLFAAAHPTPRPIRTAVSLPASLLHVILFSPGSSLLASIWTISFACQRFDAPFVVLDGPVGLAPVTPLSCLCGHSGRCLALSTYRSHTDFSWAFADL